MRRVLLVSLGLHALALFGVLALRLPAPPDPAEPARIEVVFGHGDPARPAAAPSPTLPVPPRGVAARVVPPMPAAAADAPPSRPAADDPGLQVERPDPLMISAREDPGNHGPVYPEAAQRLRQQGTVLLRLHIDADGRVQRVETLRSSGVAALDAAAVAALAVWHFLPARRDGHPVASYRDQPVSFRIDG